MNMSLRDLNTQQSPESWSRQEEKQTVNMLFGTYADILFVLLPFAVVSLFKVWHEGFKSVLMGYDLSMAAAVLAGLAVVKFIVGMMANSRMLRFRERIVFLIAGTVFLIFVPGLLFSVLIMLSDPVPEWVMFVQPLLLILAMSAYSGAVACTNWVLESNRPAESEEPRD